MPALILDFDSTIITDECLEEILRISISQDSNSTQKMKQIIEITNLGMNGNISVKEAYKRRLELVNPNIFHLKEYLSKSPSFTPGLLECLDNFRYHFPSVDIHVVSAGPLCCVQPISQMLNIPKTNIHAVQVNFDSYGSHIKDNDPILDFGKSNVIENLSIASPIVVVGDGIADMQVRRDNAADKAIGFGINKSRETVKSMSDIFVENIDEFKDALWKFFSVDN
eukprot:gb/GECH01005095.1/.p1 GENE.gb/GECH01005095.1/~~gb/GECH01005095.1/.p1  ORF type:complete len:224 (+),score=42.36 gb/GECH01005095.1/:1-672(+)